MLVQKVYSQTLEHDDFPGASKLQNKLRMNQERLTDVTNEIMYMTNEYIRINNRSYLKAEVMQAMNDAATIDNEGRVAKLYQTAGSILILVYITTTDKLCDIDMISPILGVEPQKEAVPIAFTPYTDYNIYNYKSKVLKAYLDKGVHNDIVEKVVGTTFRTQLSIQSYSGTIDDTSDVPILMGKAVLLPEPDNQYDSHAIAVVGETKTGAIHHIGYLARNSMIYNRVRAPTIATLRLIAYSAIEPDPSQHHYGLQGSTKQYNDSYEVIVDPKDIQ